MSRASRQPFTEMEKDAFARYLYGIPSHERSRPSTHKEIALRLPNHTWQAWHEHYRKKKDDIERRIEKYRRQRKREGKKATPTPEPSDEEDELDSDDDDERRKRKAGGGGDGPPGKKQRKARVEFDIEVDWPRLIRLCALAEEEEWSKTRLYQELEQRYPDHPATSWQSWHSKNREEADDAVKELLQLRRDKKQRRKQQRRSESGSVANSSTSAAAGKKDKGKGKEKIAPPPPAAAKAAKKTPPPAQSGRHDFSPSPPPSQPAQPIASTSRAVLPPSSSSSKTKKQPPSPASRRRTDFSPSPGAQQPVASTSRVPRHSTSSSTAASIAATDAAARKAAAPRGSFPAAKHKGKGKERARSFSADEDPVAQKAPKHGNAARTVEVETDYSSAEDDEREPPFTEEEEEMLVYWLAKGQVEGWAPDNVYKFLAEKFPHHPAPSWSAYYSANLAVLVMRVAQKTAEVLQARERKRELEFQAGAAGNGGKKGEREQVGLPRPPSPARSSRSTQRAAAPPPSSTVKDRHRVPPSPARLASSPVASTSTSAARPLVPSSAARGKLAPLVPPTPSPPPRSPRKASKEEKEKGKAKEAEPSAPPPEEEEEEQEQEESQFEPFTQAPLPGGGSLATGGRDEDEEEEEDEQQQLEEQQPDEQEEDDIGGGMDEDMSHLYPAPDADDDGGVLPAATAASGVSSSADDQPRFSQYSVMPSPFLCDEEGAGQQEEAEGEEDDQLEVQQQQGEEEDDEDDRAMEQQFEEEIAAAASAAEEDGQGGEEKERETVVKVEAEVQMQAEVEVEQESDSWIQETFDQPPAHAVDLAPEARGHDEEADDSASLASLDLDDPSHPIWAPQSAAEIQYIEDLVKLGQYLQEKEEREEEAKRVKVEAGVRVGAGTPEEEREEERVVEQPAAEEEPADEEEEARQEEQPRSPSPEPLGESPPPPSSRKSKKRPRSERTASASVDGTDPSNGIPPLAGGAAMGRTPSQLPSPRKKQRLMTSAEENAPPPSALGNGQVVNAGVALPSAPAPPAPTRQPLVPTPSPANLAPPSSSAAIKTKPPPPSALKSELEAIAAQYRLPFSTIRDLYYCCSAPPDLSILREMALLHSSLRPSEGMEYERLVSRREEGLWTFAEDKVVLEGSEEEKQEVEKRKGQGGVAKRRRFLAASRMTSVKELEKRMHLYKHETGRV